MIYDIDDLSGSIVLIIYNNILRYWYLDFDFYVTYCLYEKSIN